jgi:tetratricopeptide (TPR) repeat protein
MARLVLITFVLFAISLFVGCRSVDTGSAQILPSQIGPAPSQAVDVTRSGEVDLAEQMAASREAYRRGLQVLIQHYTKTGNNMKLNWAEKELAALDAIPKYDYVVEATVAGANLKATKSVSEADYLYNDAVRLEEQAGQFLIVKDDDLLRLALDKYNQLISRFPSSDKIDDAAFRAAGIYEHFKDYSIAVLYYQRTYQWEPDTPYPARYKAAFILDQRLHRRAEALQLYQEALAQITRTGQHPQWQQYAEGRVKVLIGEVKPEEPQYEQKRF